MRKKVQNSKKMYEEQGYNQNQIDCLMEGIAKGQDVSLCENPEFDSFQMNQILRGLSAGVDATIYAKTDYNWFQMEEIRKGLERKLDISSYLDANMDFRVMREVRKGLEVGLDMNPYAELGAPRMRQIRKALLEDIDIMAMDEFLNALSFIVVTVLGMSNVYAEAVLNAKASIRLSPVGSLSELNSAPAKEYSPIYSIFFDLLKSITSRTES